MSEKMFASLSSGLLARKGAAKPAMRPQGFGQMGASLDDLGWNDMGHDAPPAPPAPSSQGPDAESLSRRSIAAGLTPANGAAQVAEFRPRQPEPEPGPEAVEVASPALEPEASAPGPVEAVVEPAVVEAFEPEAQAVQAPQPAPARTACAPKPRGDRGVNGKAAFTLRLDPARHLRLRLACAVTGRSAQGLVTTALDQYLQSIPELDSLAGQVPGERRTGSKKG